MLMEKPNNDQAKAFEHDYEPLHEDFQVIQAECCVLNQRYQTLYEHYQALLEHNPFRQEQHPNTATSRQTVKACQQAHQEQRRLIQQFRYRLHKHLLLLRSYRSHPNNQMPRGRMLLRTTILLGIGNEQEAALLQGSVQQASTHRVLLAADSSQVLSLVHNVHIDVLVLDDGLTPLAGFELYHHLHHMKGLEALPAIIMSTSFRSLHQKEQTPSQLIGMEKPITGEALMKAIDQLLI